RRLARGVRLCRGRDGTWADSIRRGPRSPDDCGGTAGRAEGRNGNIDVGGDGGSTRLRTHRGGVEAHRDDRHPRRRRDRLLGRLRTGRLDVDALRGPLYTSGRLRLQLSLLVVPVGPAYLRDPARASLRLDLDGARKARTIDGREVRDWPALHGDLI